jgi:hypothetical protein
MGKLDRIATPQIMTKYEVTIYHEIPHKNIQLNANKKHLIEKLHIQLYAYLIEHNH